MDIKSILSNIFQFAKNNQFRVKLDDTLDLEPLVEALKERRNHEETQKMLLVTQNAMMVKDTVEETNKKVESAKKELNFTREEIEKLDAKVKELNNFKGEKGDSPSLQELREIIEPLILPPIKGDPGKDYVLTAKDKKEIAKSIKVPIVEKIVETIVEKQPIVTNEIKEVAVTESSEKIKEKLESLEGDGRLDAKAIKNLPKPSFGGGIKRIDGALDTRIISPTDGQALVWNSSRQVWENSSVSGGSGSPGGSDTQVQFNDGGSFGGDAGLTYNNTTDTLNVDTIASIGETFEIDAGDATTPNGNGGDIVLVTGAKDGSGLDGRLKVSRGSDNLSALLDVDDLTDDRSIAFPDKDGTLAIVSDVAYDATTWDGNTDVPTKNAIRDKIETLQPLDAQLTDIAKLTPTDSNFIVGNGTNFVAESGATARTSLGVGTGDSPQFTGIELGHASDTTIARVSAGVISVEGVTIPSISSTNTLTNKRITPRVSSETSSATPTINTDNVDAHSITALAADITSFTTNLSGTPTNFQKLLIRIKDNGTARGITWGASFEAKGVALPTTTTISKVLTVGFIYDSVTSKWGCVCSVNEA